MIPMPLAASTKTALAKPTIARRPAFSSTSLAATLFFSFPFSSLFFSSPARMTHATARKTVHKRSSFGFKAGPALFVEGASNNLASPPSLSIDASISAVSSVFAPKNFEYFLNSSVVILPLLARDIVTPPPTMVAPKNASNNWATSISWASAVWTSMPICCSMVLPLKASVTTPREKPNIAWRPTHSSASTVVYCDQSLVVVDLVVSSALVV
mmetsp:Transcript_10156/g.17465  ORF Transcript_10156/g.17465 Transcript_10156/m.17465 type:complete len:212 (+) Transcript_10156:167-802(+)